MKIYVVMYGDHGGELDRKMVECDKEDDCLIDLKEEFIKMIRETSLAIGDNFVIKEE